MSACGQVAPLLDEYVDGDLDEPRARAVRAHLRACASCAAREEELRALVAAARSLAQVEAPSDSWTRIAARLDEEEARDAERPRWWWWWRAHRVTVGGGLAAAAGLALVVGLALRPVHPLAETLKPAPVPTTALVDDALKEIADADADYVKAIDDLRRIVKDERTRWSPSEAKAFDENLAAIDDAIARQRALIAHHPGDPRAHDALYASYQREIDFLQDAVVGGAR